MKKIVIFLTVLLSFSTFLHAEEVVHNPFDPASQDPELLYKARDEMRQMSYFWIDLQMMTAETHPDYSAIHDTLGNMKKTAKKIKHLNKNKDLDGLLISVIGRMELMQQNSKKKDLNLLKQNLSFMSDTCFKCHSTHAVPEEK